MDVFTVIIILLSAIAISMSIVNFIVEMQDTRTWLDLQSKVTILEAKMKTLEDKEE